MKNCQDFQSDIEVAAQAIATRHTDFWTLWVCYLLEVLEKQAGSAKAKYVAFLTDLRDDITVRLEEGQW